MLVGLSRKELVGLSRNALVEYFSGNTFHHKTHFLPSQRSCRAVSCRTAFLPNASYRAASYRTLFYRDATVREMLAALHSLTVAARYWERCVANDHLQSRLGMGTVRERPLHYSRGSVWEQCVANHYSLTRETELGAMSPDLPLPYGRGSARGVDWRFPLPAAAAL